MKRPWIAIGVAVVGLLLAPFVVPIFVPWSGINCRHQDINIKTGQLRDSRYLWFLKLSERVKDTSISVALEGATVDVADIGPWHRVNTFSPGIGHSPHYIFHSALGQIQVLDMIVAMYNIGPERKKEIVRDVLSRWQISGRDSEVDEYLRRLQEQEDTNK